jgi:hypothetical protein
MAEFPAAAATVADAAAAADDEWFPTNSYCVVRYYEKFISAIMK